MMTTQTFQIRPYARLLTMLGEQLIKNERIALAELAKNAYDADSDWVKISFLDFGENYEVTNRSRIVIEDAGNGMSLDVIEKHWLRPATPVKKVAKKVEDTTSKGRKIQGEKGIGRFAVLKLGKTITITTRATGSNTECVVNFDFDRYDDDFMEEGGKTKELFIDDLRIEVEERKPKVILAKEIELGGNRIDRPPSGTRIEITNLKGVWTEEKVTAVYRDLSRLQSIFDRAVESASEPKARSKENQTNKIPFNVFIYKEDEEQHLERDLVARLMALFQENSVFAIENGVYDEAKRKFTFNLDGVPSVLALDDPGVRGLRIFKDHFEKEGALDRKTSCGPFKFEFYVFDFSANAEPRFLLDKADKALIKEHRIYLYRDGIRVYPYGDPDDDWLRIDQLRGTISAGSFLSNDQVVGYVNITEKSNPGLKDKTNREGLIETGYATSDFICLLQTFLAYIRHKHYAAYRSKLVDRKVATIHKEEEVKKGLQGLKDLVKDNKTAVDLLEKTQKRYNAERQFLIQRAETTEDLAGVGLSVETASHDINAIMSKAMAKLDALIRAGTTGAKIDQSKIFDDLNALRGMLGFVEAQLRDIQLLFRSAKQRRRDIRVQDILDKVIAIYQPTLTKAHITLDVETIGSPLVAKTTDAVLLQMLLNLIDNAVYWLETVARKDRTIKVQLDGKNGALIFSDNGPGIRHEDAEYIFEPFYSGKGEDGRGLGLYIARQLLERHEYSINLVDLKAQRLLSGANFVINFVRDKDR